MKPRRHRSSPNIQQQTQGGCQNEETKKHGPNERTDQTSRKRAKRNGDKQSIKTLVIRMLKGLSEDLSSIKQIQSEMKDTLIEIKNNLQGNNSRMDGTNNQINDLEHKEPKKQPIMTTRRKKNPKHEDSISSLWNNFKRSNIRLIGVPEGEEEQQK